MLETHVGFIEAAGEAIPLSSDSLIRICDAPVYKDDGECHSEIGEFQTQAADI